MTGCRGEPGEAVHSDGVMSTGCGGEAVGYGGVNFLDILLSSQILHRTLPK